jgi:hypothetical protein
MDEEGDVCKRWMRREDVCETWMRREDVCERWMRLEKKKRGDKSGKTFPSLQLHFLLCRTLETSANSHCH